MGITKTSEYTEQQLRMSTLLKALGHPARVAILEILVKRNSCVCGDIVEELPLSQPTVSQHLKELKIAGLIRGTIEGNSICYCVDLQVLEEVNGYLSTWSMLENQKLTNKCC